VKQLSTATDNLTDRTIALWQPRLGQLTPEDARQIVENVTGFFSILREWSRATDVRGDNKPEQAK